MFRVRRSSFIALIVVAAALGALWVLRGGRELHGVPLNARPAPGFSLTAPYRGPVTLADFQGDAVLLTFGRPSCGAACNPQLATLKDAVSRLGSRRVDVRVLFVTLESDGMNEQGLLAFVQDQDLGFTGLMGDPANTWETAEKYQAIVRSVPDSVLMEAATVDGSDGPGDARAPRWIYGIDRNGVLRVAWGPADPGAVARDVRTLLRF